MMPCRHRRVASAFLAAALLAPVGAAAQGLSMSTGGDNPITVTAEQGIEWHREAKEYHAKGNATAERAGITLRADTLIAHYREKGGAGEGNGGSGVGGGKTEIHMLEAVGNVIISSPTETAYGDRGRYDADTGVAVLIGKDLRLITEDEIVTARDALEYWDKKQIAVARGDAKVERPEESLEAETLVLRFTRKPDGSLDARRVDAIGNVKIVTPTEVAFGDEGVYDVPSRIATLVGNVRITRGENQLNGSRAEVNLETGISRLIGGPDDRLNRGRVNGLLVPTEEDESGGRRTP